MDDTQDAAPPAKIRSNGFRRSNTAKLPIDAQTRQGTVTRLAFEALGKDQAIAYLNTLCPRLGGRPLELATATSEGLGRVRTDLAERANGSALADNNN